MDSNALKDLVIDALDDIKGLEIVDLNVEDKTDIADHMVVASGTTARQVKALTNNVLEKAKAAGMPANSVEGMDTGEWVLVDLGDVLVHIMLPRVREFYDIERLWSIGPNQDDNVVAED